MHVDNFHVHSSVVIPLDVLRHGCLALTLNSVISGIFSHDYANTYKWHRRLVHIGDKNFMLFKKEGLVTEWILDEVLGKDASRSVKHAS